MLASEDISIVQVDQSGLIGALSVGTTRVSATAGDVTIYYDITVVPRPGHRRGRYRRGPFLPTSWPWARSANISVSVSPSSAAASATVSFTSSNEAVATVNNFGRVTAVGKGSATITVTCGDIVRTVDVTVYIPTDGIHLNTNYLVLKPGETAQIRGSVSPSTAPQALTFRSSDTGVATVSGGGTVTAVGTGSTSIIVSNGDSSSMVTVIVNRGSASGSSSGSSSQGGSGSSSPEPDASGDPILQQINDAQGELVNLHQADVPVITSEMLNALRRTGKTMSVTGDGYILTVAGSDIRNTQNVIDTAVTFTPSATENGVEFTLNQGGAMPCTVDLTPDRRQRRIQPAVPLQRGHRSVAVPQQLQRRGGHHRHRRPLSADQRYPHLHPYECLRPAGRRGRACRHRGGVHRGKETVLVLVMQAIQ